MHRHEHFDLYLHDDEELASLVHGTVLERVTLQEWPLSCVQRLTISDGRRMIYKTQFGPTVESEFYASVKSSLLVSGETIYRSGGHVHMLIEYVKAPLLKDLNVSEEEAVQIGRTVTAKIAQTAGRFPFFVDVSTENKWRKLIEGTLKDLGELVDRSEFSLVDRETVSDLEQRAFCRPVLSAIHTNPCLVHGDLTAGNIFVLPDGQRVVDWQRPVLGPTHVDLAILLESLGIDPLKYVDEGVVWAMYLLRIHWFVQCAVRWFPQGTRTYDKSIARLASLVAAP